MQTNILQFPFSAKSNSRKNYPPKKIANSELRTREHLFVEEVNDMIRAVKGNKYALRDKALLTLMYRHGLRASEAVHLKWDQINFAQGLIYVKRIKKGINSTHPLRALELRMLRQLKRESILSPYVFVSNRKAPLATRTVRLIVARAGKRAKLPLPVHPHMLRHACGYYLASQGHDTRAIQCYLGHAEIKHTVKYTALAPDRFNNFFED